MSTEQKNAEAADWGFLRPFALWGFVILYNGLAAITFFTLRDQPYFIRTLLCGLGFFTLALLLGIRFCSPFRKLLVKPDFDNQVFLRRLRPGIIFWMVFPTVFLFCPDEFLDVW